MLVRVSFEGESQHWKLIPVYHEGGTWVTNGDKILTKSIPENSLILQSIIDGANGSLIVQLKDGENIG